MLATLSELFKQLANALAFAPKGAALAAGGWDRTVRVWKLGGPAPEPPKPDRGPRR